MRLPCFGKENEDRTDFLDSLMILLILDFSDRQSLFNLCQSVQSVVNSYFNLANASLIRRIASTIFSSLVA